MTGLPDLLTDKDVARLLRVSTMTVRNERQRGRLGFVRVGGRIFFTAELVEAYIQDNTVRPCPENRDIPPEPSRDSARSANSGSARSLDGTTPPTPGAAPGMIDPAVRHATSALAKATFQQPLKRSAAGMSSAIGPKMPTRSSSG
jgi:excisionase family DNA binding protein